MSLLVALILLQNIDPEPQVKPPGYDAVRAMTVPVIPGDINDRPYRVIGEIKTAVRKMTVFEKDPSEAKVYRELWERAQKLGADAVVNAKYSETLYGGWTWGRRHASGQAIKFLTDEEVAARQRRATPPAQARQPNSEKPKAKPAITCVTCD